MKIAVYGSLRKGQGNEGYLHGASLLNTETLYGYDMYSLGVYPYIVRGNDKVIVELYDIPVGVYNGIKSMELDAHYRESVVNTSLGEARLFVMDSERHSWYVRHRNPRRVQGGDWREYLMNNPHPAMVYDFNTFYI